MTEALQTLFEGKEIRVLEQDNDLWFPLVDLAAAWGVRINTLYQILNRQSAKFTGFVSDVHVTSTPSEDESWHKSVNEQGMYLILGAINTDRLKDKDVAMVILRFQRWVPELIQRYRKKEIALVKPEPEELDEVVAYDLREARQIAELTGTDPKLMQAAALRRHKNEMYDAFAEVLEKQALSVRHGEPGWYNPSGLVELCNDPHLTADRLNKWLENYREDGEWKPFQYREGRLWRLTKRGMEHGREYQYNLGNGHSEPRISWRSSVLYACGLKRDLAPDQMALPARAGR
jgi:prophage antirepressor-like protein